MEEENLTKAVHVCGDENLYSKIFKTYKVHGSLSETDKYLTELRAVPVQDEIKFHIRDL